MPNVLALSKRGPCQYVTRAPSAPPAVIPLRHTDEHRVTARSVDREHRESGNERESHGLRMPSMTGDSERPLAFVPTRENVVGVADGSVLSST